MVNSFTRDGIVQRMSDRLIAMCSKSTLCVMHVCTHACTADMRIEFDTCCLVLRSIATYQYLQNWCMKKEIWIPFPFYKGWAYRIYSRWWNKYYTRDDIKMRGIFEYFLYFNIYSEKMSVFFIMHTLENIRVLRRAYVLEILDKFKEIYLWRNILLQCNKKWLQFDKIKNHINYINSVCTKSEYYKKIFRKKCQIYFSLNYFHNPHVILLYLKMVWKKLKCLNKLM